MTRDLCETIGKYGQDNQNDDDTTFFLRTPRNLYGSNILKASTKSLRKEIFGPEKDRCFFGSQKNRYPRKAYRGSQPPQVCISLKLGKLNYCQRP